MDDELAKIGPALKRVRLARGVDQRELARRLKKSPQEVSRVESEDSNPRWSTVAAHLRAMECSALELGQVLDGSGLSESGDLPRPSAGENLVDRIARERIREALGMDQIEEKLEEMMESEWEAAMRRVLERRREGAKVG